MQSRTPGGLRTALFADLAGAPTASIIVVQSNAVVAFNSFNFYASDVGDYTNWTTGEAVGATPLHHRPGTFVDAVAFKDYILAFKATSIYRLRYVGGAVKWTSELVTDGYGALSGVKGAVISTGDRVYFWDAKGPMMYDGSTFTNLAPSSGSDPSIGYPPPIRGSAYPNAVTYVANNRNVVWKSQGGSYYYVYNEVSDAWGIFSAYKAAGTQLSSDWLLIEGTGGVVSSPITNGGFYIVNLSDGVYYPSLDVAPTGIDSSVTATPVGDELRMSSFTRVTPILLNPTGIPAATTTATLASTDLKLNIRTAKNPFYFGENETYGDLGSGFTNYSGNPVTSSNDQVRFDFMVSERWAEFEIYATAKFFEIEDIEVTRTMAGTD